MAGEERLGRVLVKAGVVSQQQLAEALELQAKEQKFLGQIIVEKGWCSEKEIVHAVSLTMRLRPVDVKKTLISQQIVRLVPKTLAIQQNILPLLLQNNTLYLAMENPLDSATIRQIETTSGMQVMPLIAMSSQLREAVRRHYNISEYVGNMLNNVEEQDEVNVEKEPQISTSSPPPSITKKKSTAKGHDDTRSKVLKLWNMILAEGMKARASDIHIEPAYQNVKVRYRVDGMLSRGINLPKEIYTPLLSRIKMQAGMDIAERKHPQDGHMRISYAQRKVNLRISTVPISGGEQVVIRILEQNSRFYDISRLGLTAEQLELFQNFVQEPQGLILVTGPTGSGKTTTLYALLNEMKDGAKHIVTIEDPIEYQLEGITQIQVTPKSGLTFANGLRSALRQDPNVILLGEIRDAETASVAMQAAETGHLVLSTLHTTDAISAINRLFTLGLSPEMVASNLLVVIAQRLVRRMCPRCLQEYTPGIQELRNLGLHGSQAELTFYRGSGCKACKESGYYGRIGLFEMFIPDEKLREQIGIGLSKQKLRRLAIDSGMQTMLENGTEKVLQGSTTVEEVIRVCPVESEQLKKKGIVDAPENPRKKQREAAKALQTSATPQLEPCKQCGTPLQPEWLMCPMCGTLKSDLPNVSNSEIPTQEQQQVDIPKTKERVVIAEDDADARMMIKFFLQRQGYQVILAVDGEEALEKIKAERPDVVILDVNMPKKDGFEVCKAMRSRMETMFIPVIMLTALSSMESKLQGLSLGADDYLTKPFHPAELAARIEVILRRSYQHEVISK